MNKILRFLATVLLLLGFFAGMIENTVAQPAAAGANKFLGNITTSWQVRPDFMLYWNQITGENEHKWGTVEGTRGQFNWTSGDRIANFARLNSIPWRFHALIWGSQYPQWMDNLSTSDQLAAITNWMNAAAARYPDVQMIDVVNEGLVGHAPPTRWKAALGGDGATGWDWVINSFKMARERWPNAILKYNDFNIVEWEHAIVACINMMNILIANDTPIDALGVQAHNVYRFDAAHLQRTLDRLAVLGLPIFVTELDIPREDDQEQLRIMRELFPVMWNHPSVVGITHWGYIVGSTWVTGTGLKHPDGTHRPALTWLLEYVRANPNPPNNFPNFMKTGGGTGACPPTEITPRFRVDQGEWQQLSTASIGVGATVEISPLPETGGSWTWTGPGGFTANTRTITRADIQTAQSGLYTATHTNDCGAITMQAFSIIVTVTIPGKIEAESYSSMSGIQVEAGAQEISNVGYINQGDWTRYGIDVQESGSFVMRFRVATGATANNNIVVKNQAGATLGTLVVDASRSNGWQDWYIDSIVVELAQGNQELTLEFQGTGFYLFNIDWFELSPLTITSADVMPEFESYEYSVWAAPNPFAGEVVIMNRAPLSTENLKIEIYNISGEKIYQTTTRGNAETRVEESAMWKSGIYFIVLSNSTGVVSVVRMLKANN